VEAPLRQAAIPLTASGGQCVRTARENKVESEEQFDSVERNPYRKESTARQCSGQ